MDDTFKFRAAGRTDDELHERINNREKYLPETVEASVAELTHRGVVFSDEELKVIAEDMQARRDQANTQPGYDGMFNNLDKIKQVDDPDAPSFYSKRVIYAFSILFSVFFASIMFAVNVSKTPKRINVIWIVIYGFVFTIAELILGQAFRSNLGFVAVGGGILGSYPLNHFFWNRYLGNNTLYRVKPVWIPLIIGIAISALYLFVVLKNNPGGM